MYLKLDIAFFRLAVAFASAKSGPVWAVRDAEGNWPREVIGEDKASDFVRAALTPDGQPIVAWTTQGQDGASLAGIAGQQPEGGPRTARPSGRRYSSASRNHRECSAHREFSAAVAALYRVDAPRTAHNRCRPLAGTPRRPIKSRHSPRPAPYRKVGAPTLLNVKCNRA